MRSSGEKSFIIADWIFIIGITPFAYFLVYMVVINILNSFLIIFPEGYRITHSSWFFLLVIILASIGFLITLTYVIKNKIQQNKRTIPMVKTTDKFLFGVFLIYIGHIGLIVVYVSFLDLAISPGGTASLWLLAIPAIPWMFIFYLIGYSMVNKQKLLKRFRQNNELEKNT